MKPKKMVERATTEVLSLSAEGVNNGSFNPTTAKYNIWCFT